MNKCPQCCGTGLTDNHVTGEIECSLCLGSGEELQDCPECEGRGYNQKEVIRYGHDCDGTEISCQRRCPVPVQDWEQDWCVFCEATGKVSQNEIK